MYSVFLSSYTNTRESLGELEKAVETLACGLCSHGIDHFHKWRPIINSFASIKISLTDLILKSIIQKKFYSETRLVRLI